MSHFYITNTYKDAGVIEFGKRIVVPEAEEIPGFYKDAYPPGSFKVGTNYSIEQETLINQSGTCCAPSWTGWLWTDPRTAQRPISGVSRPHLDLAKTLTMGGYYRTLF